MKIRNIIIQNMQEVIMFIRKLHNNSNQNIFYNNSLYNNHLYNTMNNNKFIHNNHH